MCGRLSGSRRMRLLLALILTGTLAVSVRGQPNGGKTVLKEQTSHVYSVAFSPEGKTFASWSDDNDVKLRDLSAVNKRASVTGGERDGQQTSTIAADQALASGSMVLLVFLFVVAVWYHRRRFPRGKRIRRVLFAGAAAAALGVVGSVVLILGLLGSGRPREPVSKPDNVERRRHLLTEYFIFSLEEMMGDAQHFRKSNVSLDSVLYDQMVLTQEARRLSVAEFVEELGPPDHVEVRDDQKKYYHWGPVFLIARDKNEKPIGAGFDLAEYERLHGNDSE